MPRLSQDKFHIFISHKHEDSELAIQTKRVLHGLGKRKIKAFVSSEDLVAGTDWNRAIKMRLAQSHMLLLLFTTPARNWDWCLYEAGLFTRFENEDIQAVVCLFDSRGDPPRPISNLQGIRAEVRTVKMFLRRLCRLTWEVSDDWRKGALRPNVTDKELGKAATKIVDSFKDTLGRRPARGEEVSRPCHRIVLDFADDQIRSGIPKNAKVIEGDEGTSDLTLELFGLSRRPHRLWTWGDLVNSIDGPNDWRLTVDDAFTRALKGELFEPIDATFSAYERKRKVTFKPIIYRIIWGDEPLGTPIGTTIVLDRLAKAHV